MLSIADGSVRASLGGLAGGRQGASNEAFATPSTAALCFRRDPAACRGSLRHTVIVAASPAPLPARASRARCRLPCIARGYEGDRVPSPPLASRGRDPKHADGKRFRNL